MHRQQWHLYFSGRVQGVGFRYYFARQAQALRLSGWVRNLADGRVEAVAAGPPAALESLLAWVRQGGVAGARVDRVETALESPADDFGGFQII